MEEKEVDEFQSDFMTDLTGVMKKIFSSCDPEGTNYVRVSNLINYIKPFMNEDLSALDCLRNGLDPESKDAFVSSQVFYNVMNDWAKRISSSDNEESFNRTPSQLDYIDDKELPINQSTPRASYGQKLLNYSIELLNLSNVSSYSSHENKTQDVDVTIFEERIKMLQYEIHKCKNEMSMMKTQLTQFEEQNEVLQLDLNKTNKKLHAEKLVNENFQKQAKECDDLKEALNTYKKRIDDITKKQSQTEKENEKLQHKIKQQDELREILERKCEDILKKEQEAKNKILDIKYKLDMKEIEISNIIQSNDGLTNELNNNRDLIDYLKSENEQLLSQKVALDKVLGDRRINRVDSTSVIYKGILDTINNCNYEKTTLTKYTSPPAHFTTPPISSIPIWRPKSSDGGVSVTDGPNLRRLVLNKGTPDLPTSESRNASFTFNSAEKHNQSFNDGGGDEVNQYDSDDSFTKHQHIVKLLNNHYGEHPSLHAELCEVSKNLACTCGLVLEEKNELIHELQEQLSSHCDCSEKISRYEDEIRKLCAEKDEMKKNMHFAEKRQKEQVNELESQITLLQSEKHDLLEEQQKYETVKQELINKQDLNTPKIKELEDQNNLISQLKAKIATLRATVNKKDQEIVDLNKIKSDAEWKKILQDQLQSEIYEKSVKLQSLHDENEGLKERVSELITQLHDGYNNKEELAIAKERFIEMTNHLEEHRTAHSGVVVELESMKDTLVSNLNKMETEVQQKMQMINELRNTLKKEENVKNALWRQIKRLESENQTLREEDVTNLQVIKRQEDQYNDIQVILNKCQADLNNLFKKVDEDKIKYEELLKQTELCQKKIENKDAIISNQEALIKSLEKKIEDELEKNITVRKLEITLKEKDEKIKLLESDKQRTSESLMVSNNELNKNSTEIFKLNKEIDKNNCLLDKLINRLVVFHEGDINICANRWKTLEIFADKFLEDRLGQNDENNNDLDKVIAKLLVFHKENEKLYGKPVQKLEKLVETLIAQHESNLRQIEMLKLEYNNMKSRMAHSQEEAIEEDSLKRTLSETSCYPRKKHSESQQKPPSYAKQQLVIERRLESYEQKIETYQRNIIHYENKLKQTENELEIAKKKLVEIERKLETSENKLEEYQLNFISYETKLKSSEVELMESKKMIEEYICDLDAIKEKLDASEQKLVVEIHRSINLNVEKTELTTNIKLKNGEISILKESYVRLLSENESLKEKIDKLICELDECRDNLTELNCNLDDNQRCFENKLSQFEAQVAQLLQEKYEIMSREDVLKEELELLSKNRSCKEKLEGTVGLLKSSEMELNLVKGKIEKYRDEIGKIEEQLKERTGILSTGRQELGRITTKVLSIVKRCSEDIFLYNEQYRKLFNEVETEQFIDFSSDVEEELQKLSKQIKVATFLLEIIAIKFPKHMDLAEVDSIEFERLTSRFSPPDESNKLIKRFTLRPPRLIVSRPDSPDSPSLELDELQNDPCTNSFGTTLTKENVQCCLDSDGINRNLSLSFDESYKTAIEGDSVNLQDEKWECLCPEIDLQQLFPNVTDSFLEKLGLHETSEPTKLSKEETEKLFTTLVIQLTIDSNDYKERKQKQKDQCIALQEKMLKLLREVTFRLRDHKCIGAMDSVKPIFIMIEEVRQLVEQVVTVAAQYGVLSYEGRMMRCWNLVTNYMAMLRQEVAPLPSPSTKAKPTMKTMPTTTELDTNRQKKLKSDASPDESGSTADNSNCSVVRSHPCALIMMCCIILAAIVLFFVSLIHVQCRMVSPDDQPCPLDFLMQKKVHGPPPF